MQLSHIQLSKFFSLVLRHKPEAIGATLDLHGWIAIDQLIVLSRVVGTSFTREDLYLIVNSNDKKRFSLSDDGERIRAAQGHSVAIELGLPATRPPTTLYHGTAMQFANLILLEGLKSQARQQVHLTDDPATARRVGRRHGKPVVL